MGTIMPELGMTVNASPLKAEFCGGLLKVELMGDHLPAKAEHDVDDLGEASPETRTALRRRRGTRAGERSGRGGHEACPTAG
jgi:hypothetical protein